jgi:integrase
LYASYYLGLRRGELLGLTWSRVSLEAEEIHVIATTSKGRKERVVPLAAELVKMFKQWRDSQAPVNLKCEVLPWPYDSYRGLYEDWHAIQTRAGMPEGQHYVPKNCRSTCASDLIARQVPTVVVKDWLGHAGVTTTERYYINTKPALRSAADKQEIRLD